VPPAWQRHFCISSTNLIVPVVTNADKPSRHTACGVMCDHGSVAMADAVTWQLVTFFVSLCFGYGCVRSIPCSYLRQDDGRYLPLNVLGVQDQRILPPLVVGESTRNWLRIARLALAPWKDTVILPPFTSTLDT